MPGVTVSSLHAPGDERAPRAAGHDGTDDPISVKEFAALLRSNMELLEVDRSMAGRYLNDGFSGGEKKRIEILQMAMLKPELAILDETDSGLDIDALKVVSRTASTTSPAPTSACS